jgi:hypothetical protein
MSYFAQLGKPLAQGSATLTSGTLSATLYTAKADEWVDVYSIVISTNDTATETVTVSDGTTSLAYLVGGTATGANPPTVDQGTIPVRFKKAAVITATASAVSAGKSIIVNLRALTSKT